MLVLFDVDGTLLRSRGVGLKSMQEAIERLHGRTVDPRSLDTGGRLDHHLFKELLQLAELPDDSDTMEALQRVYIERMQHHFSVDTWSGALDGAPALVEAVHQDEALCSAVLTGNLAETCWLKIKDAGFRREWFDFGVFGDEGLHRRDLPGVALRRYQELRGATIAPERVVVIGDTPHDVDCALHSGCRVIAVTTGKSSREVLEQSGAHLVVDSLTDVEGLLRWIRNDLP